MDKTTEIFKSIIFLLANDLTLSDMKIFLNLPYFLKKFFHLCYRFTSHSVYMHARSLQLCPTFSALWTIAHKVPLSLGFSRHEYWGGFPCPPPEDLPDPGMETTSPVSPALEGGVFTTSTAWEALLLTSRTYKESSAKQVCPRSGVDNNHWRECPRKPCMVEPQPPTWASLWSQCSKG